MSAEAGMHAGVRDAEHFLLVLTAGVLFRPYCVKVNIDEKDTVLSCTAARVQWCRTILYLTTDSLYRVARPAGK